MCGKPTRALAGRGAARRLELDLFALDALPCLREQIAVVLELFKHCPTFAFLPGILGLQLAHEAFQLSDSAFQRRFGFRLMPIRPAAHLLVDRAQLLVDLLPNSLESLQESPRSQAVARMSDERSIRVLLIHGVGPVRRHSREIRLERRLFVRSSNSF